MKRLLVVFAVFVMSLVALPCFAISESQERVIVDKCNEIKEQLKAVQKDDARTRVHLGGRYETILTSFMTPLNVRLLENNLSNVELVENQNDFAETKSLFNNDYINYQQGLEELVSIDCKKEPASFYEKLDRVRQKRKIVGQDALKLRNLISKHVRLVTELRGKI